jgi:hypothetical protein
MNFAKRVLMFLGSVVLAAALVSVLAPKATHALVATLVQVANTTANPVPNSDVDNPGRATLVVTACNANSTSNDSSSSQIGCISDYTVPGGNRLVIQQVEANCATPTGQSLVQTGMLVSTNGNQFVHQLPLLNEGAYVGIASFMNDLAVHFYADPGSTLRFDTYITDTTDKTDCVFTASGYLISYP